MTAIAQLEFQILIGIYCTYDLYDEGLNQFFKHFQGTSSSSSKQPPYSPRSSLLSPVKFGDQLQPQLKAVQPPSGSSYTSYRLPSYSRDNLIEKLRQVRISNSAIYLRLFKEDYKQILVIKTSWIYQNSYKNQLKVIGRTYLDIYFLQIERMAIQRIGQFIICIIFDF